MDRHEAALVVVGVEQSHLLMAMHDVDSVVDIERHRLGLAWCMDQGCRRINPNSVWGHIIRT